MKKTLIVVDMQNDFIDMALGTKEAVDIMPKVKAKIEEYAKNGDEIIYTRDTHGEDYLETPEGKKLPVVHCVKGTKGWEIADGLYVDGCKIIDKPNFGWPRWDSECLEDVEIIGLCTDICVVSNALIIKAVFPNADVKVDKTCCAGVTPESHEAAITTMRMCQIDIIGE
ncbi:MAG: cysteine hydrolase [Oscillospiraceae bacterium]|nr:cysteine hydrolase [Oscillospiraceae bacterium]